jgi:hypothetical protein
MEKKLLMDTKSPILQGILPEPSEVGDFLFVGDHLLSHITPHQSPICSKQGNGLAVYYLFGLTHSYSTGEEYSHLPKFLIFSL